MFKSVTFEVVTKLKHVQIHTLALPIDHGIGHMMKLPPYHQIPGQLKTHTSMRNKLKRTSRI